MNSQTDRNVDWIKSSPEEVKRQLKTEGNGLTAAEAQERLRQYGYNEIIEKKLSPALKFFSYFWGPIPWMIETAAVLSAIIHHWEDFWIIFLMLLINAGVGFGQAYKADTAIEALKKKLALKARVKRSDVWTTVPARELVPGDLIRIRLGEIIPADIKLLSGAYLQVDESALTGESLPVEKHTGNAGYSGSVVKQGEMDGLVVATGMNTYFGRTAQLVEKAAAPSHFQKAVIKIADYLIALAVFLAAVILIVALFRHDQPLKIIQFVLILTVASIPVALPAVLTVTMAVGATLLAAKDAIVNKLVAIEEMAGVDILCSDKTGTITKGELDVKEVKAFAGFTETDVKLAAALASREEDRDPIDDVVLAAAKKDQTVAQALSGCTVETFKPFDPVVKRTEAVIKGKDGSALKVAKGAPQAILELVTPDESLTQTVNAQVESFAQEGLRALAVARTDKGGAWRFVGMFAIYDAPREDSAETIKTAKELGLTVKMVTGDHAAVAREIAGEVGLGSDIQPAAVLLDKTDREAEAIVEKVDGFAQVFPEHKYHIVELLQTNHHIVGMTGDGVNDAPALKRADAGIAVSGATDAAKSAAAIVLTKPGLSVIIDAIQESRRIFKRMNSYTIYRMAETIRVLLFMTFSILVFNFYPVTAAMIVILALLNDIPIMMIAYDNTKIYSAPVSWNMRRVLSLATVLGIMGVFASFLMFWIGEHVLHLDRPMIQTLIFLKLTVAGHMTIYLARTGEDPFWKKPYPAWPLVVTAELTQVVATLFAVYGIFMQPIGWKLAAFVWAYALVFFVLNDAVKVHFDRLLDHAGIQFRRQAGLARAH